MRRLYELADVTELRQRLLTELPTLVPTTLPPESYTRKHLADRILTSKAALEGERKQVTVLFADL